ncbi:MAG: histidine kinase [Chloroflexi bacterium]|nr:histidine kinase [Chloroflexota bacterium]
MPAQETARRIEELEQRIADLQARLPKHSVPPPMILELEELEEELACLRARLEEQGGKSDDSSRV